MSIEPLEDRVLVRPGKPKEVSDGGIVLPDSARHAQDRGEVLAVGPGRMLDSGERAPLGVAVGDTVIYAKFAAVTVEADGEPYLLLRENDILAVARA